MNDEEHLERIREEVITCLWLKKKPYTTRNIIHAMFKLRYADWVGGEGTSPTCEMEGSYGNGT